jgi:hypothetical protein
MKMLSKNLLILFICLLQAAAYSEVVTSIGEYSYGPEISKAQGCRLALDKAKSNALATVLGESVSTEQQLFCKETSGKKSDYGCDYNSISWSLIDGDLKNQKIISEQVVEKIGATTCTVKIEVGKGLAAHTDLHALGGHLIQECAGLNLQVPRSHLTGRWHGAAQAGSFGSGPCAKGLGHAEAGGNAGVDRV